MTKATAIAVAAALFLGCDAPPPERRADAARLMSELMSGRHPIGGPFALADAAGQRVDLAQFQGKLVLLYFGYAGCPDVCPIDLAVIGEVLRELGPAADEIEPLFVTLDPRRDTPAVLREYAAAFHPRMRPLTGTEEEVRRVATSFKVFYEKVPQPGTRTYVIDHTPYTFLLDREGRFLTLFPPGTPAARMLFMLRDELGSDRPKSHG